MLFSPGAQAVVEPDELQRHLKSHSHGKRVAVDSRRRGDVLQVRLNADAGRDLRLVEKFDNRLPIRPALE